MQLSSIEHPTIFHSYFVTDRTESNSFFFPGCECVYYRNLNKDRERIDMIVSKKTKTLLDIC